MNRHANSQELQRGFTLMEVSLSVGIAASWVLLALGLMGVLVDQVRRSRQDPVLEGGTDETTATLIQLKFPKAKMVTEDEED